MKFASFLALAATAGLAVFLASTPAIASPIAKVDVAKVDPRGIKPDVHQTTSTLGALSVTTAKCIGCQCHTSKSCAITCCLKGEATLAALKRAFYGPQDTQATPRESTPSETPAATAILPSAARKTDNAQVEETTILNVNHHIKPDVTNPVCRGCPCSETGKLCNYACCVTNAKAAAALAIRALRSAVTTDRAPRSVSAAGTGATALVRKDAEDGQIKLRGLQATEPAHLEEKSTTLAAHRAEVQVSGHSLKSSRTLGDVSPSPKAVVLERDVGEGGKGGLDNDRATVIRDSAGEEEAQVSASARAQTHRDLPLLALGGLGEEH